ncbi:MAG TPA: acyl-CoA dehydrogenase family protein [Sphingobium sp.]|uniref:acyl-CoA dehydrogenase family protein n=1 Tax=Sphingobium sp. TaxID=1912891 RepID=UPI002ED461E0
MSMFAEVEELEPICEGLSDFIRAEVMTRHERYPDLAIPAKTYDETGAYRPWVKDLLREVRMASAAAGYYAMSVPEEIGGGGLGFLAHFLGFERIFHMCGSKYWLGHTAIAHWAKGPSAVFLQGSEKVRREILPGLLSGEKSICFALSEPVAGSDATRIQTRAQERDGGWLLNGNKIWITNGPYADYAIIFAVTDQAAAAQRKGGISAFLVPTDSPGFKVESLINMWGHTGTDEGILVFEDIRIEKHQLLGELNKGFSLAMLGVGMGRLYNSAWGVGAGRWAVEQAIEYSKTRETFGQPIASYQSVLFPLAESMAELHSARLAAQNVGHLLDTGQSAEKELAMVKLIAVDAGMKAVDRAMQVHGAMGFTNEMHLTDAYIYLRKVCIADGSREILLRTIGKELLKGNIAL